MKKFLKVILISLLTTFLILSVVSCDNIKSNEDNENEQQIIPELDMKLAKRNLEKVGYSVYYETTEDELGPGKEKNLWAYIEDEDGGREHITITEFKDETAAKLYYEGFKAEYDGLISENQAFLDYYTYLLEEYEDEMSSDQLDMVRDNIHDIKEEIEEETEEFKFCGISGKFVWSGTKMTIEDSK